MKPFDAFRLYNAVKLHFTTPSYDAFKYSFKTSAKEKSFWGRRDKYYFAKLASKYPNTQDLVNYYVSFFVNDNVWVGDMISNENVYTDWLKRVESLSYSFEQDMRALSERYDSFDDMFVTANNTYPPIIQDLLSEDITIETVVILDQMLGIMEGLDRRVTDTLIWPDLYNKVKKYSPFIHVDIDKMKKIVKKVWIS